MERHSAVIVTVTQFPRIKLKTLNSLYGVYHAFNVYKAYKEVFFFYATKFTSSARPGLRFGGFRQDHGFRISDSGKGFKKIHSAYRQIGNVEFSFQDGSGLVVRCGLMYQWSSTRFGICLFLSVIVVHVNLFIAKFFYFPRC